LVEVVAPRRLGTGFRWLIAATWTSNLGDGFALAAAPLLVASQNHDPRLVALAVLLQQLPWLVIGPLAGALADRLDRRLIVITADLVRSAVLVVLGAAIQTGAVDVGLVLATMFVLGTAEAFGNTASATLPPMLVARDDLALANARLLVGFVTLDQLAGPPMGAALFAADPAAPFIAQAVLVATAAALVARVQLAGHATGRRSRIRRDIAEGFAWVVHNPAVRTLVLTILTFNVTFGAAWSVLVLYAKQRLGLGAVGFGLLTAASAVGGVAGTAGYGALVRRVRLSDVMRIGLIIETLTHLSLALTTVPAVAFAVMFVFGAHAFVWGTTSISIRQRAVPPGLQGRVGSLNAIGTYAGLVVGDAIGGPIASRWGITAPFWFAFAGSALFVVVIWRQLRHIAHADDAAAPRDAPRAVSLSS
jgi:predicted MFS family arabinose efflux permease